MAIVVRLQHHHIHLILNLQNENKKNVKLVVVFIRK